MRYYLRLLILGTLLTGCKTSKMAKVTANTDNHLRDVTTLASDMMEGRAVGTDGEKKAAGYIARRMTDIGLTPRGNGSSYLQQFRRITPVNPHAAPTDNDPAIEGLNVVGSIDNGAPYMVVIGAHYDHLGMGGEGSLYDGPPAVHNGADDNASGVAIMLSLAETIKQSEDKRFNYLFIAFSGEERGLWGSNYYTKHPTIALDRVSYMLNMDMVGRLNDKRQLAIYGTGTSPVWENIIDKIEAPKFQLSLDESGIGPSDHTSFYLADIPVLHFFTGQHEHYHKPGDDIALINFAGMHDIANYILKVIGHTDHKKKLAFTKTASKQEDVPDFKVTLGVMPDYLYDGEGMRIDGVREGRPAHAADIQKGDVVRKIGEYPVTDMMSYMKCLSLFAPGDTVEIVVQREDMMIMKSVTF